MDRTRVYYGSWTNSRYPKDDSYAYHGWWSAFAICNISEEPQDVPVTILAKGEKYTGVLTLSKYGIYTAHIDELMKELGHDPLVCVGAFMLIIENTEYTHSVFLIHNCTHSYTQQ